MSETYDCGAAGGPRPEQMPPGGSQDEATRASREAAEGLRAAYGGWLKRRYVDLASTPHFTMRGREFDLLRNAPSNYLGYVLSRYGIPQDDQANCQYALVDIEPDGPNLPPEPKLVIVAEADFGTTIDPEMIALDFQSTDPGPQLPDLSGGALKTVNIAYALARSSEGLQTFAAELMRGTTVDPLSSHYGDTGVRAGGLVSGQKDAYVWTTSPFARSVELTLAFPTQYDSVCIVRGQRREAPNGKAGMAQIVDPEVVLEIEGENLRELQRVYQALYHEPDFALTEQQRRGRDELFNDYLAHQISYAASRNRQRQDDSRQQPLRAREIPRS